MLWCAYSGLYRTGEKHPGKFNTSHANLQACEVAGGVFTSVRTHQWSRHRPIPTRSTRCC